MRQKIRLLVLILTLAALVLPVTSHAAVVGRFTMVKGQVDLLKQGKIPAIAAKYQDGVEIGDVIRTKSKAKAQLTMVDDSVITLAPESRLAISDYQYNPARGERRAVVRSIMGLVHTVVKRIIKTEQPNFIMETHTATISAQHQFARFWSPPPGRIWLMGPWGEFQPLHRSSLAAAGGPCNHPDPMGKQPFLAQA
jgi:hypothetical protein